MRQRTTFDYPSDQTWVPTRNVRKIHVATAEDVGRGGLDFDTLDEQLLNHMSGTNGVRPGEARPVVPVRRRRTRSEDVPYDRALRLMMKIAVALRKYNDSVIRSINSKASCLPSAMELALRI